MAMPQEEPTSVERDSLPGRTLRNGEYQIQRQIGRGRMGNVYLAFHTTLQVHLALKQVLADRPLPENARSELDYILHGGDITRRQIPSSQFAQYTFSSSGGIHTDHFLREALVLARLQHPAIPTLYDYFFEEGYWFLVMDYIPGETLSSYVQKQRVLPTLEALNYAMQICDILDYLHKLDPPIVFRALEPTNIIISPEHTVTLIDFDSARYANEIGSLEEGAATSGYAPLEQYQPDTPPDIRSDLYSLGVLLHEMMSGQRPQEAQNNPQAFYDSANTAEYLILPQHIAMSISTTLGSLLKLATRANIAYRFQSAQTLYLALERAYEVEEKHSYQRHLLHLSGAIAIPHSNQMGSSIATEVIHSAEPLIESVPFGPARPLEFEQRKRLREELHRTRHQRLEHDQLEQQLASVDESLRRRSSISLSHLSLDRPITPGKSHFVFPFHRIIQMSFIVALVMCLLLVSLLIYARMIPHTDETQNIQPTITALQPEASHVPQYENYWQALPSLPVAMADNSAVYVKSEGREYIYLNGGYRGANKPAYDRNLYRYDIAAASWEVVKAPLFPGMINNAAVSDEQGNIFFSAGYSTDSYTIPSLLYKHTVQNMQTQKIVPPDGITIGFGNAMATDGQGNVYVTQGFTRAGDNQALASQAWYRYSPRTDEWKQLAPLPVGLGYVILVRGPDDTLLLVGGSRDAGQKRQTNRVYRYNIKANSWTQTTYTAPYNISGAASCMAWPQQLLVVGGYNASKDMGSSQSWLLDLRTGEWKGLVSFTVGNSVLGTAACDGQGHAYIVRGGSDPRKPTTDFWETVISVDTSPD